MRSAGSETKIYANVCRDGVFRNGSLSFEKYIYTPFELNFDPGWTVAYVRNNYGLMFTVVFLYALFVAVGRLAMASFRRPLLSSNSTLLFTWNLSMAFFSFYGASRVTPYVIAGAIKGYASSSSIYGAFVSISCKNQFAVSSGPAALWICLFVFSKIFELGDTVLLILRKRPLSILHVWHHLSVLPWAWNELGNESAPSATFAMMNLTVHFIMYGYFAVVCTDYGRQNFPSHGMVPKFITFCQCAQMFSGIVVLLFAHYHKGNYDIDVSENIASSCNVAYQSIYISLFIYSSYLILFLRFANNRYGICSRLKMYFNSLEVKEVDTSHRRRWPWQDDSLPLEERYSLATNLVTMLSHLFSEEEGMVIYGSYKRVDNLKGAKTRDTGLGMPDIMERDDSTRLTENDRKKAVAQKKCVGMSAHQAMTLYIMIMDIAANRYDIKHSNTRNGQSKKNETKTVSIAYKAQEDTSRCSILYDAVIIGHGKAIPRRAVNNSEVEKEGRFSPGSIAKTRCGVKTRYHADLLNGENQIQLACKAIKHAIAKAGLDLHNDVDCIIHCSGVPHQGIPDDACLIQRELGLGDSGVPSFTVHATCLSFLVAMDIAGSLIQQGRHRTIILSASNTGRTHCVDKSDLHTAPLFGDAAAAIILSSKSFARSLSNGMKYSAGAINHFSFETFGSGSDLCTVKGGGSFDPYLNDAKFKMNGPGTISLVGRYLGECTGRFVNGLDRGLKNLRLPHDCPEKLFEVQWVVPHQASALALDALSILGWDKSKIIKTLSEYGNCIGVSIPLTLVHGIESGKIVRGDKICLVGTSAGISFGGMILTY